MEFTNDLRYRVLVVCGTGIPVLVSNVPGTRIDLHIKFLKTSNCPRFLSKSHTVFIFLKYLEEEQLCVRYMYFYTLQNRPNRPRSAARFRLFQSRVIDNQFL